MKIGIITFHWSDNYGAVWQAYALHAFLAARGHSVEIIDYRPEGKRLAWATRWLARSPARMAEKWRRNLDEFLLASSHHRRHTAFERFRAGHLVCTRERFRHERQLGALSDRYDLVITGSDQVWNPDFLNHLASYDAYTLGFAGPGTRRMAYAASFGLARIDAISADRRAWMKDRIAAVDAISVREASGLDIVRELTGRTDAVAVSDPTLLLPRDQCLGLAGPAASSARGVLFSYMLHGRERDAERFNAFLRRDAGLDVVHCNPQASRRQAEGAILAPGEWLRQIRDASFVVTNSFHGVVFCLIFHTPFLALTIPGRKSGMNNRITELLHAAGLSRRIMAADEDLPAGLLEREIDWNRADAALREMKTHSAAFLELNGI